MGVLQFIMTGSFFGSEREKPCCSKVFTVELNTLGARLDLKQYRQLITGSKPNLSALIPKSHVKLSGCTCSVGRVCHSSAVSVAREHNLCVPNSDYSQNYWIELWCYSALELLV